jgi:hypothetical protein
MPPAIFYVCYLPPKTGGELVNLQHVAYLNRLGIRAVALVNGDPSATPHSHEPGDALSDLPCETLMPGRQFGADDIVVIPEFYAEAFRHFATQPCRRVIHNQGPFLSFRGFESIAQMNADGLSAGLSCSTFGKNLLLRMGSRLSWQVVTPFVHPLFHEQQQPRMLQVAYMPDKRPREAPVVKALLHQLYPDLAAVPWVPIAGVSRRACAEIMAQSAVFASFSWLEGLGLPPLEAMAAGCLVCGFDGHGGSDFATPDNGLWVAEGDHEGYAHAVAATLEMARAAGPEQARRSAAGHATAAGYSRERFTIELEAAWHTILGERWEQYRLEN